MTRRISVCLYCDAEVETTSCPCNPGFVPVTVRVEIVPAAQSLGLCPGRGADYLDGKMGDAATPYLAHLSGCRGCRADLEDERQRRALEGRAEA